MDGYIESVIHLDSLPSTVTCGDLLTLIANKISQDTGDQFTVVTVNNVGAIQFPNLIPNVIGGTKVGFYTDHALSDELSASTSVTIKWYMLTRDGVFIDTQQEVKRGQYAYSGQTFGSASFAFTSLYADPTRVFRFDIDKSKIATHGFYSATLFQLNTSYLDDPTYHMNVCHTTFVARAQKLLSSGNDIALINIKSRSATEVVITCDMGETDSATYGNAWFDAMATSETGISFIKLFRYGYKIENIYMYKYGTDCYNLHRYLEYPNLYDRNGGYMWKYGMNIDGDKYLLLCVGGANDAGSTSGPAIFAIKKVEED